MPGIRQCSDIETIGIRTFGITKCAVVFLVVVGTDPWPIIVRKLERIEQLTIVKFWCVGEHCAVVTTLPYAYARYAPVQRIGIKNIGRTNRTKIALGCVVRPLAIMNRRDQFENQKIQVCPTLTMRVTALIDWHAIQCQAEIDTMIEIDAAQKILIGLALTTVLANDQPRYNLENFTRTRYDPSIDLCLSDGAFISRIGSTQQTVTRTEYLNCGQTANVIGPSNGQTTQKRDGEAVNLARTTRGVELNHDR